MLHAHGLEVFLYKLVSGQCTALVSVPARYLTLGKIWNFLCIIAFAITEDVVWGRHVGWRQNCGGQCFFRR